MATNPGSLKLSKLICPFEQKWRDDLLFPVLLRDWCKTVCFVLPTHLRIKPSRASCRNDVLLPVALFVHLCRERLWYDEIFRTEVSDLRQIYFVDEERTKSRLSLLSLTLWLVFHGWLDAESSRDSADKDV